MRLVNYRRSMSECENESMHACSGCALKSHCTIMDDGRYSRRQRWKALLIAYIIPFILLAGVIAGADALTDNEYIIGGAALAVVAIYYLILFFRKPEV